MISFIVIHFVETNLEYAVTQYKREIQMLNKE